MFILQTVSREKIKAYSTGVRDKTLRTAVLLKADAVMLVSDGTEFLFGQ